MMADTGAALPAATLRRDPWWLEILPTIALLGGFTLYALYVIFVNNHYYAEPYLSPFYSPCLAAQCQHLTLPLVGRWWTLSPALLVLWAPLGFRATCYYYRKAYYRAFFWAPPAAALGGREPPQRTARRRGMGQYDQRRPHRPLHPPGSDGRPARYSDSLMGREPYETHPYDVLVIGAGGAGLRAAIEAAARGARTAVICKSLLGKAHTVMAEGGAAAALGNVWPEDTWAVHFRDTMRGGKLINNWRMVELFAKEAPERVLELEEWGAVFDRTPDGLISQRDFGGHRYGRLAHVGDRTGLEIIRTLQYKMISMHVDVFMECTVTHLLTDAGRIAGACGYRRDSGGWLVFPTKAVVLATGGFGKVWRYTSMSWESTGDR